MWNQLIKLSQANNAEQIVQEEQPVVQQIDPRRKEVIDYLNYDIRYSDDLSYDASDDEINQKIFTHDAYGLLLRPKFETIKYAVEKFHDSLADEVNSIWDHMAGNVNENIIKYLVDQFKDRVNVNEAFYYASQHLSEDTLKYIINSVKYRLNINQVLQHVGKHLSVDIIKYLVDLFKYGINMTELLDLIGDKVDENYIKYLVKLNEDDININEVLGKAGMNLSSEYLDYLVKKYWATIDTNYLFVGAGKNLNENTIKFLVDKNDDINFNNLFIFSGKNLSEDTIKYVIEHAKDKLDVNYVLVYASKNLSEEYIKQLVKQFEGKIDINHVLRYAGNKLSDDYMEYLVNKYKYEIDKANDYIMDKYIPSEEVNRIMDWKDSPFKYLNNGNIVNTVKVVRDRTEHDHYVDPEMAYEVVIDKYNAYPPFKKYGEQLVVKLNLKDRYLIYAFGVDSAHFDKDKTLAWARVATARPGEWTIVELQSDVYSRLVEKRNNAKNEEDRHFYERHMDSIKDYRTWLIDEVKNLAKNSRVDKVYLTPGDIQVKEQQIGSKSLDIATVKFKNLMYVLDSKKYKEEFAPYRDKIIQYFSEKYPTEQTNILKNFSSDIIEKINKIYGLVEDRIVKEDPVIKDIIAKFEEVKSKPWEIEYETKNKDNQIVNGQPLALSKEEYKKQWLIKNREKYINKADPKVIEYMRQNGPAKFYDVMAKQVNQDRPEWQKQVDTGYGGEYEKLYRVASKLKVIANSLEKFGLYKEAVVVDNILR